MMNSLQSYFGSKEEEILKEFLTDVKNKSLINIVIKNCNAIKPVSFSKADVILEEYVSVRSNMMMARRWPTCSPRARPKYLTISYQQMFNKELIDEVSRNGLVAVPEENIPVLLCLLEFMKNIKKHQEAMFSIRREKEQFCAVLAEHFFSKLVPGQKYCIDENTAMKHDRCPCLTNCSNKIRTGNTGIGSGLVWHGHADIFIDETIAISVIKDDCVDDSVDDDDTSDDNTDDTVSITDCAPLQKRQRTENGNNQKTSKRLVGVCADVAEVENKYSANILLDLNIIDQIIAETITNAFAQVNRNACLQGRLIPTLGCSPDHVLVLMYDPENDVLLHSSKLMKLWAFPGELNLHAVIQVWLFLNFTTFIEPDVSEKYELRKAMFHYCVGDFLCVYKEASYNEKLKPADTNFYADFVLPCYSEGAELVREKTG